MEHKIEAGMAFEKEITVTGELTAEQVGSGLLAVYATPYMIALMEQVSELAVINGLAEGFGTVGTSVDVKHIAATPVGMRVTAAATLREVDGRRLVFEVTARDEREVIGNGTHERFIIQKDRFMARVKEKI
jgi:predicted thioesterase